MAIRSSVTRLAGSLACLAFAAAAGLHAQNGPTLSLSGGPSEYDLSGTGVSGVVSGRLDVHLSRFLVIEPGLTVFHYTPQQPIFSSGGGTVTSTLLMPEVSIQAQLPLRVFRPFLGVGVGRASETGYGSTSAFTLHAVGGTRIQFRDSPWGVRAEVRVRTVDLWGSVMADYTAGLSYQLR